MFGEGRHQSGGLIDAVIGATASVWAHRRERVPEQHCPARPDGYTIRVGGTISRTGTAIRLVVRCTRSAAFGVSSFAAMASTYARASALTCWGSTNVRAVGSAPKCARNCSALAFR